MSRRSWYLWGAAAAFALMAVCVALPVGYYLLVMRGRQLPGLQTPGLQTTIGAAESPVPVITNVHTSLDATDTQPASEFAQSSVIYAHFIMDAEPGSRRLVQGSLRAVAVEGLQAGTPVAEIEVGFPAGPGNLPFSSSKPWPLGRYRIELTADGKPVPPLEITVVGTNTSGAQIENLYAASDQAGEQRPEVFPPNGSIYVHFTLVNAPVDTHVRGVIVARQASGLRPDTQITETADRLGDGAYWFEFFNSGPWPAGDYSVYVYLNGQFAQQVDLQIQ